MWSGIACASTISTPLYSQRRLKYFPKSDLNFSYIVFLRYFGVNTMWYWQFHFVCDKLLVSSFFIDSIKLPFLSYKAIEHYHYTIKEVFSYSSLMLWISRPHRRRFYVVPTVNIIEKRINKKQIRQIIKWISFVKSLFNNYLLLYSYLLNILI